MAACYSTANAVPVQGISMHSKDQVLWELPCSCMLYKSPHAVSCSHTHEGGQLPKALQCPLHGPIQCSRLQCQGYMMAQVVLSQFPGCMLVYEARVTARSKAFDAWVLMGGCRGLLVEFDGRHHSCKLGGHMYGTTFVQQQLIDWKHSMHAVRAGYTVLRMHCADVDHWPAMLAHALQVCMAGAAPQAMATPAYKHIEGLTRYVCLAL